MKIGALVLMGIAIAASSAVAQQQPVDPRVAGPMIQAQAAEIALRDAAIKAMQEDAIKKEADLAAWFKGYFPDAPPPVAKADQPDK